MGVGGTSAWGLLAWLALACSSDSGGADGGPSDVVFELSGGDSGRPDTTADPDATDAFDSEGDGAAADTPSDPGRSDTDAEPGDGAADETAGEGGIDVGPDDGTGGAGDASEDGTLDDVDLADGDASDAADVQGCALDEECGFGYRCDVDHCVALECHLGDWAQGIPDKPCPEGTICDVLIDPEGSFSCVAFSRACTFQTDCPFGFRCEAGSCALSDCTVGNMDAGYGPRLCEGVGEICACMEDGADINGGRGVCVTDPVQCP
jgi:hypothetical protein